ncbi:DUF6880 family protein [Caulobacter sp. S45]|uniref:DUF6880 family protein n=1 Tax=Caulobacter sp. S45 TaxID=1641861 RepID=UPI00131BD9EF|nr:DUF6880 family protein [Caulobacter sp. S45]
MKGPSTASLKRVNAENLAGLGAERLAGILLAVANTRPELKRQLRMELAASQGVEHLAPEIDKRLTSLETLTSKVSWRQRPTFLRDLDALRQLIAERMASLDQAAALDRMWRFINVARRIDVRVRDKHGELDVLFDRAADDLGRLVQRAGDERSSIALADAIGHNPRGWRTWLPVVLGGAPEGLAAATLRSLEGLHLPGQVGLVRQLADAAGDVDAYRATYLDDFLREPANAAEVANRLMAVGRIAEAGELLEAAVATAMGSSRAGQGRAVVDFEWETSWIDYLERSGHAEEAQTARWSGFERTLSVERAKAFTCRLADFADVEAENRAFDIAAKHKDFQRGLAFLMGWPATAEAGRMIEARSDDIRVTVEQADLWAPKLRQTKPRAAHLLLRKAAAEAFRRREFATCDRLTQEAEAIELPDSD